MADWPATTKIETLMIPDSWTEFYIKIHGTKLEASPMKSIL
jgi:hypothetical protein